MYKCYLQLIVFKELHASPVNQDKNKANRQGYWYKEAVVSVVLDGIEEVVTSIRH